MIYPQTVSYAIEALGYMASLELGTFHKVKEIAAELNIPEHFLGKILSQLVRKKLLISSKGPTGGISLGKAPNKISLFNIIAALDALDALEDKCILGLRQCSDKKCCPFHDESKRFKNRIITVAKQTTLAKLAKK
ncbi:MAG: Rrf2 family transcriptional regulator [candidate division Zixibacteria bacterium]|nr:Rrf2 family transcriptional regulator [candidate division Zixibacteria bacterium]